MKLGSKLPEFTLLDSNHQEFNPLKDVGEHEFIVIYFYPKDFTPGCTKEACSFRDNFSLFQQLNANIIGISQDSVQSHQTFKQTHHLPFTLLSDPKGKARKLFGVKKILGLFSERTTFVFNPNKQLIYKHNGLFNSVAHIQAAINNIKSLQ